MRLPRKPFVLTRALAFATGVAAVAVAALPTDAAAQFRGGFRNTTIGARPMPSQTPHMQAGGSGFQKFKPSSEPVIGSRVGGGKGKGTKVSTTESGNNNGSRRPPHRRPPHGKYPPGFGPAGPIGGTGVAVGSLGPIGPAGAGLPPTTFSGPPGGRGGINLPPGHENRFVPDEVVLEFAANSQAVAQLLARHGLQPLEVQSFALTGSTFVRARILGSRSVRSTLGRLSSEAILRTGQPNYRYFTAQTTGASTIDSAVLPTPAPTPVAAAAAALPGAGDPAQYALRKLRLSEAHALSTGDKILVAVIDSGIDLGHPELQGVVAGSFDALGKAEKPHSHGTGIAGAIAAHGRLLGAAPSARILAIRAFGSAGTSAEATTYAIMKGVEYASARNARVINMSFAGPADPSLSRQLAAARANGVVLVAASGNFGPKSGPQYPAADPNVIAVSATDANDRMFKAASVGPHIAVTAPGVDILVPAPNADYQVVSGTSFAAAHVSGIVALILQRAPELKPDAVRRILEATAKDLGPRGKDKEYGAGLADAYQAIMAAQSNAAAGLQDRPKAQ